MTAMRRAAATRILLLALLLLVAQLGATVHTIGHAVKGDDEGAPEPVCELCAAYGHLAAAAPLGVELKVLLASCGAPEPNRPAAPVVLFPGFAYLSQGPPFS
jgi:hypothetical protein